MNLLKKLFGKQTDSESHQVKRGPSAREVAEAPALFADWVNEYIVLSQSFEDDLELGPNEEQCKNLNISEKERKLCANERVLLRALGACIFVRHNLDEKYYLAFREALLPPVAERMDRNAPYLHHDDPVTALDEYLESLKSDSQVAFSMAYLERVYPETPSSEGIFLQGIPIHLGLSHAMDTFEIVRDGYSQLATGLSYKALEALQESENKPNDIEK